MLARRVLLTGFTFVGLSIHITTAAVAESYPSRPITVIVPFPAGGPTDTIARVVSERMSAALGQPIIVENITGAAGSMGAGRA